MRQIARRAAAPAQVRTPALDPDGGEAGSSGASGSSDALSVDVGDVGRRYDADLRGRVWSLHLRGHSFRAIAQDVGIYRESVARIVRACYAELGQDHEDALRGAQDEAIAHLRHIQRQAWSDHDLDAEREAEVLKLGAEGPRFMSQRAQYLRLALDCEREIARLRGLYGVVTPVDDVTQVVFHIERVEPVQAAPTPAPIPAAVVVDESLEALEAVDASLEAVDASVEAVEDAP